MCLHAEWLVQQQRRGLCRHLHLLPVQVEGHVVQWELYLYGDMSIKVDRDSVEVLPRGCATASVLHPWQRITHYLCAVPAF